jgi:hypothetical protein
MPSIIRLARLAISPTTRALVFGTVRSPTARDLGRRAATDPKGLVRHLSDPATLRQMGAAAAAHPAVRGAQTFATAPDELPALVRLARAGMIFLPLRYMPAAWVGLWAARRLARGRRPWPGRPNR